MAFFSHVPISLSCYNGVYEIERRKIEDSLVVIQFLTKKIIRLIKALKGLCENIHFLNHVFINYFGRCTRFNLRASQLFVNNHTLIYIIG